MAEDPRQPVVVAAACDGACSGNPGPGGWGCLLRFDDGSVEELGGADPSTTNNRMELTACLAVLQRLGVRLPPPMLASLRSQLGYPLGLALPQVVRSMLASGEVVDPAAEASALSR